jgi:tetratricopeptide (TPR) repeat protein
VELLDPGARAVTGRAGELPRNLRPAALWKEGCAALARGEAAAALARFEEASRLAPSAGAFDLSRLLALIALKRWPEVDDLVGRLHPDWGRDPRYAVASALAAVQRGNLEEARALLDPEAARELAEAPSIPLIAEAYFHFTLLDGRAAEARDYALRMAERLTAAAIPAAAWTERAGDAAFAQRDLTEARQLYEKALAASDSPTPLLLKLADVHFLAGNLAAEKSLREKIYGSLDPK